MATEKTHDKSAEESDEKVTLIKHSLLSAYYLNRSHEFGVTQFLNRLKVFIQEPSSTLVLKKHSENRYQLIYQTLMDGLWVDQFRQHLIDSEEAELGDPEKDPTESPDHFYFNVDVDNHDAFKFNPDFCLIFYRSVLGNNDMRYERITKNSGYFKHIEHVVDFLEEFRDDESLKETNLTSHLTSSFDKYISRWKNGSFCEERFEFADASDVMQSDDEKFFEDQYNLIKRLFEKECKARFKSPLSYDEGENLRPANIVFMLKQHNLNEMRFKFDDTSKNSYEKKKLGFSKGYNYGVRGIFTQDHAEQIKKAFKALSELQDGEFKREAEHGDSGISAKFTYAITVSDTGENQVRKKLMFHGRDDFFWEKIKTEDGRNEIIETLNSPYSAEGRSLADLVLNGGFVAIAKSPVPKKSFTRLTKQVWDKAQSKNPEFSDDYKRIVYYYYVMTMTTPAEGRSSTFLVPCYVAGTPWFAMMYYFTAENSKRWFDCYHFYHTVCDFTTRGIQTAAQELYLEQLTNSFYDILCSVTVEIVDQERSLPELMSRVIEETNLAFQRLARVYPFKRVEIKKCDHIAAHIKLFDFDYAGLLVALEDNPYFQQLVNGEFISLELVRRRLRIAEQEYRQAMRVIYHEIPERLNDH